MTTAIPLIDICRFLHHIGLMTIHLIKLSVGPEKLSDLEDWQAQRLKDKKRSGQKPELIHITRSTPKRAEELLDGGSIYWVIKGFVMARQKMLELRPLTRDGMPYCGLVFDKEMVRVKPQPRRPFQGWRYLEPKEAPKDMKKGTGYDGLPEKMARELAELGLL